MQASIPYNHKSKNTLKRRTRVTVENECNVENNTFKKPGGLALSSHPNS